MHQGGAQAALAYLNRRTSHRYTGSFRFGGEVLRSEALVDGNQPLVMAGWRCDIGRYVLRPGRPSAGPTRNPTGSNRCPVLGPRGCASSVVSYCGVLIRDAQAQPYGTLCHYDIQRGQKRTTDQAAAALRYQQLRSGSAPKATSVA